MPMLAFELKTTHEIIEFVRPLSLVMQLLIMHKMIPNPIPYDPLNVPISLVKQLDSKT